LAAAFFIAAIFVVGLPPFSGFLGKLQILHSLQATEDWPMLWGTILIASFVTLLGFAQAGSLVFWKSHAHNESLLETTDQTPREQDAGQRPLALPATAIGIAWGLLALLTIFPGPVMGYLTATVEQLFDPQQYINAVLASAEEVGL
jgi:multicomponent K+:H+ antiporter subunit D